MRLFLLASIWLSGCAAPNPVKGWKAHYANLDPPNRTNYYRAAQNYQIDQSIIDDHKHFVETLKKRYAIQWVAEIYYYEDGTGQHAVKLTIKTGPRDYNDFYLMYDKANARTKVIKGKSWQQFHAQPMG
jgi:hypothetical protein